MSEERDQSVTVCKETARKEEACLRFKCERRF